MNSLLKIIFAGTPSFAAIALEALLHSSHQVIAVYTQPDRPAGRGLKFTESPVKILALKYAIPLHQPLSLKEINEQKILAEYHADVMVVAAYGMLLPAPILRMPRLGCINIHPSLLPRFRGATPIQRTIMAGDIKTGISIMQMDEGLDTGPVLLQREYLLSENETTDTLHDKLAVLGGTTLIEALDLLSKNKISSIPQDNRFATYANKISKEEMPLDFTQAAILLERKIRAFNPKPVATIQWQQQLVRIWFAKAIAENHPVSPGTIVHASRDGIDIATSDGILRLLQLQLPGGKVISVADFYHAKQDKLIIGKKFS